MPERNTVFNGEGLMKKIFYKIVLVLGSVMILATTAKTSAMAKTENKECNLNECVEVSIDLKALFDEQMARMETEYWNLVIAQVDNYVNVRSMPSEDGEVLGKLYNNSVGEFISEENGWYRDM